MSAEANKKLIHEVIDVIFNQQQLDRVEEKLPDDPQAWRMLGQAWLKLQDAARASVAARARGAVQLGVAQGAVQGAVQRDGVA